MTIAVLTGGTSGLGRFVARGLIQAGWRLVLVARDAGRAQSLRDWLRTETPEAQIEIELADLSLLADARRAGETIADRHPAIGLAVLNAGTFQTRRRLTAEGHEMVLAVNHLAPFVLTRTLAAPLRAACGRLVVVGSSSSDQARIDPDNLELSRGWSLIRAYPQSKLALMMTSFAWARRLAPEVSVNVVHPGIVGTDLVRAPGVIGAAWKLLGHFALSPEQGAVTPLRAALDPAFQGMTGRYIKPAGLARPNPKTKDSLLVDRVWNATERLVPAAMRPGPAVP